MQNENKSKTVKYPLASAGRRIIAKALDIVIISIVVTGLGFAIFCTDPNFAWHQKLEIAGWRYGLFVSLMAIIFFSLMLVLPRLWGKTIGMKAFKLSYFLRETKYNYTFAIFKHELFIWEIVVFIAFIMGWTLAFLSPEQVDALFQGANAIFANQPAEGLDKACYYVGTGFSCFYGISILFLIAIIVATCIKNNHPAFHDKYSHVYVIHTEAIGSKFSPVNKPHKDDEKDIKVPGHLSAESLDEIDNI